MNISIRQIETFYYTAKLGSISLAAEKLCITQAAASMALKEFENQLGHQLFERSGKRLVLNEKGAGILETSSELLAKACELTNYFSETPCLCGSMILGTIPSIANYVLPKYISSFINQNRKSNISIHIGNSQEIIERVIRFEDDAAIIDKCCCLPMIKAIPWLTDELAIVVSSSHPLAEKENISPDDLMMCDWIMREQGAGSRRVFESQMAENRIKIRALMEMESNEAIMTAVAESSTAACLTRNVIGDMLESGRLKALDTPFMSLSRQFYFITHREKYRPKIVTEFISHLGLSENSTAPTRCSGHF